MKRFFKSKVETWVKEIKTLALFARTQPHAVHAATTHGLVSRWTYALRVSTLSSDEPLRPLEEAISQTLLPVLTGQPAPSTDLRNLLALPVRLGGMGVVNPMKLRTLQQDTSLAVCEPLVAMIKEQQGTVMRAYHRQMLSKSNCD